MNTNKYEISDKVNYLNRKCKVVYIHKNSGLCGYYYTYDLSYNINGIEIGFMTPQVKEGLITKESNSSNNEKTSI